MPAPASTLRRGGRPSRAESEELAGRIVAQARSLFLSQGYGATSIEAVVQACQISKRTFYHRFPDKAALFAAVVHEIVESLHPPTGVPLIRGQTLREQLVWLARLILAGGLAPEALALYRMIVSEAERFPDLAHAVLAEGGSREALTLIARLFGAAPESQGLAPDRATLLAEQFLHMVLSLPRQRALGLGTPMQGEELVRWAEDVVTVFLSGIFGHPTTPR
jgi:AcrR family transcriptional regulator